MLRNLKFHSKSLVLILASVSLTLLVLMTVSQYPLQKSYEIYDVQESTIAVSPTFPPDSFEKLFLGKWPKLKAELVSDILKDTVLTTAVKKMSSQNVKEAKVETKVKKNDVQVVPVFIKGPNSDKNEHFKHKSLFDENFEKFLKEPIITPFEITYRINNPKTHCTKDTYLLIAIPSSPENFMRRQRVRKWDRAVYKSNTKYNAKLLFFLGSPSQNMTKDKLLKLQEEIDSESAENGDIIQATFIDEYKNLTKKASLLLHWASTFCKDAKFFIRTDDDVRVTLNDTISSLERKNSKFEHFIVGHLNPHAMPFKDPKSRYAKYIVPDSQWPAGVHFPPFLLGGTYGFPIKTAGPLLEAMRRSPFLWLDDVFVTGICADRLGVPLFHDQKFAFKHWQ